MVTCEALLVLALAIDSPAPPPAVQRTTATVQRAGPAPAPAISSEELAALRRIRRALNERSAARAAGTKLRYGWFRTTLDQVPTYRVEVTGHPFVVDFRSTLQESVAHRLPRARPGFLDGAPGVVHPAAPLIGFAVSVDPASIVRAVRRWAYNREVEKARREVAEELAAVIKAQEAAAQKKPQERR